MAIGIVVSLLAGGTIVLGRTVNARLAQETGLLRSTLYNYVVGLAAALVALCIFDLRSLQTFALCKDPILYTGGIIGVAVVLLLNLLVTKVPSFYMTLLLFVGQVFAGLLVDWMLTRNFSVGRFVGGLCVALGLSVNLWLDRKPRQTKS